MDINKQVLIFNIIVFITGFEINFIGLDNNSDKKCDIVSRNWLQII